MIGLTQHADGSIIIDIYFLFMIYHLFTIFMYIDDFYLFIEHCCLISWDSVITQTDTTALYPVMSPKAVGGQVHLHCVKVL